MQSYLIERNFGHVTPEQLAAGGSKSKHVAAADFADTIVWKQSHATETADGLVTYCLYEAASEDTIREHATAAGSRTRQDGRAVSAHHRRELR